MAKTIGDPWTVYMLRCADGSLYTGITTDVKRRCKQHNAGTASRYTRSRRPARLVYQEGQPNRSEASKREAAIKTLSRRQKEAMIRLRTRKKAIPRLDSDIEKYGKALNRQPINRTAS